jgi:hypothetical protein
VPEYARAMAEDRVVVVCEHGPRRRRRRRGMIAAHVAVLASIALSSGALAGGGGSDGTRTAPAAAPSHAIPSFAAGEHRSRQRCHRGEGRAWGAGSRGSSVQN